MSRQTFTTEEEFDLLNTLDRLLGHDDRAIQETVKIIHSLYDGNQEQKYNTLIKAAEQGTFKDALQRLKTGKK